MVDLSALTASAVAKAGGSERDCSYTATQGRKMTAWQQWLQHPERLWVRRVFFQIHLWVGAGVTLYVLIMSISGSLIVYRDELSRRFSIEWLVNLHENLLSGSTGRLVNGIGAICLTLLCWTGVIIWWPGTKNWHRCLSVNWRAHFARISWDLHSALGFWCFCFVLVWGTSGIYFSFPKPFDALFLLDPTDRFTDQGLFWLSQLHFGRFGWFFQTLWSLLGLVPAVLAFTGVFICCRRVIFKKPCKPEGHAISSGSI
jgi:uncharacterized iron-regulated membrane protein